MSDDILAAATAALRAESDRDTGMAAEATRFRLRRSLAERTRIRRRASVIGVVFAILFGSTVTWAWSTGRVQSAWRAVTGPAPTPVAEAVAVVPPKAPHARAPAVVAPPVVEVAPAPVVVAVVPVEVASPVAPAPKPRRVDPVGPLGPVAPLVEDVSPPPTQPPVTAIVPVEPAEPAQSPEVEALYRTAHELHFRGGDAAKALAAWDAYLAAEPSGRFLVEAKYNRAIVLVKLKRYDEAKAALGPFARGEVKPAGYRQAEAQGLLDRIAAMNGSNGSGH